MSPAKRKETFFFGEYVSPRRNKFYYSVSYLGDGVEFVPFILLSGDDGISVYSMLDTMRMEIYTPHCLQRINDRFKIGANEKEIIKWLSTKWQNKIIKRDEDIKSKTGKQMKGSITIVADYGVFLSQELSNDVIRHNTFIGLDMTRGKQKEVCDVERQFDYAASKVIKEVMCEKALNWRKIR